MSGSSPHSSGEERPRRTAGEVIKDIALFFASPFVTMGCLAMFPIVAVAEFRRTRRQRSGPG